MFCLLSMNFSMGKLRDNFTKSHILAFFRLNSFPISAVTIGLLILYSLWQFQEQQLEKVDTLRQQVHSLETEISNLQVDVSKKIEPKDKVEIDKDLLALDKDLLALDKDIYGTVIQALGGTVVLLSIFFTWHNLQVSKAQQITDRFTKAVEQLGQSDNDIAVRLGGIYALERIAIDSEKDHWTIMEIITTYIRDKTRAPTNSEKPSSDIQAALWVLGRRMYTRETKAYTVLYLSGANLKGANLFRAHFEKAWMRNTNLEKAQLQEIHLEEANLERSYLVKADLTEANLKRANLSNAHLEGANLSAVNLQGANLTGTHLEGVDLSKTLGLTQDQIESAYGDVNTILPNGDFWQRPESWLV